MQSSNETDEKPSETTANSLIATIDSVISFMGRYQILLFVAFLSNGLIFGINHNLTAFHIYTPTFYCENTENGNNIENSCAGNNCSFDENDKDYDFTIVVEWSLICEKRLLGPLVNTLYFTGVTIGAIFGGILSDKYGRKYILFLCIVSQWILGILLTVATEIGIFILIRMVQGFFVQGMQGCCINLLFEYSPPKYRAQNILLWLVSFSCGVILLSYISYETRDWRMLQYMISFPSIITFTYMWAVPDSIYWHYATNRKPSALKLCLQTAYRNNDYKMIEQINSNYSNKLTVNLSRLDNYNDYYKYHKVIIKNESFFNVIRIQSIRKHMILASVINFSIVLAHYGSVFLVNHLDAERHRNYFIGCCAEIIGMLFLYFVLKQLGTKFTLMLYLFGLAFLWAAIGLIFEFVPDDDNYKKNIIIIVSVITKSVSLSALSAITLYNCELFPTICRGAGTGVCGFFARTGSVTAPFLMVLIDEEPGEILPLSILTFFALLSAIVITFLPDTRNINLPHSIAESQELWDKKK